MVSLEFMEHLGILYMLFLLGFIRCLGGFREAARELRSLALGPVRRRGECVSLEGG